MSRSCAWLIRVIRLLICLSASLLSIVPKVGDVPLWRAIVNRLLGR